MKTRINIIEVSRVATITLDGTTPDVARHYAEELLKHEPGKIDFRLPPEGKDIIINTEQIG